jgi:imidazolonepropionase-like amidohydrolase
MFRIALIAAAFALTAAPAWAQSRTVIGNVNIVTLDERGVIESGAIVIRDGKIERVLDPGQRTPRGAAVIDGQGGYLIPGLIDAPVHFNRENELASYLRYGVTSVLSLGDPEDTIEALIAARRRQAAGELTGAHLYATGRTIANHVRIETVAEVEPYLDWLEANGFEFVKTYNEIPQPVFDAVVDGARRRDMGVFSHMPRSFTPEYSLTHGINVVAHMEEFFFTTFEGPRDRDLEAMRPDWMPDYARIDPILDIAAQNDVAIIPNLVASDVFRSLWVDESRALDIPDLENIHPEDAALWRQYNYARRPQQALRQRREQIKYPLIRTMTYRAQQRGVLLLAGTDAPLPGIFPGRSLHQELRLLVAAGLSNEEALRAATINGGTAVRRWVDADTCIGAISPGCEADLVLLSANPLDDVRNAQAIVRIFADGRAYTPEELEALARPR